ncbi:MAG: hypothetical protein EBX97_01725 [Actinobacteria bacterium]|jgi:hypothetical protein|nr:hypothetical protein [Actinomycetota bacterium]
MVLSEQELDDILWENYYFLATTRVQAMEAMWGDLANGTLLAWALDSWGITSDDIVHSFTRIAESQLIGKDINEMAYEPTR